MKTIQTLLNEMEDELKKAKLNLQESWRETAGARKELNESAM